MNLQVNFFHNGRKDKHYRDSEACGGRGAIRGVNRERGLSGVLQWQLLSALCAGACAYNPQLLPHTHTNTTTSLLHRWHASEKQSEVSFHYVQRHNPCLCNSILQKKMGWGVIEMLLLVIPLQLASQFLQYIWDKFSTFLPFKGSKNHLITLQSINTAHKECSSFSPS